MGPLIVQNNLLHKAVYRTSKFTNILRLYVEFEYLRQVKKVDKPYLGKWTKEKLIDMGPTFIKIGQFLSTRTDVFGEEITNELKELQDNVSPLPYAALAEVIKPIRDVLLDIQESPIASASIGQVHIGTMQNGDKIVLKVKRPNIEEQIIDDFETLLFGISILKQISEDRKIKEFEILFNEYYNLLKEEIDFVREANNMKRFRKNFSGKSWVKIPKVYPQLSNNDLITMEYVPTIKIDDTTSIDNLNFNRERVAQKLVELFINQVIDFGMVHIDPHPGNVGITKNGKIVFYDFGMILDLDLKIKENFTSFLIAVYDKDINTICNIAIKMGLIVVEPQNIPYFKTFLISFLSYVENANIEEFKVSYINKINQSSTPFLISSKFVLLLRGISILEGVCKKLDPNFNFKKTLDPYIDEFVVDINYFEARAMSDLKLITKVPDKVQINQIQIEVLEKTVRDVEKNVKKEQNNKYFIVIGCLFTYFMHHEFDQGILTALITGLTYSFIINGKVHKE